MVTCRWCGDSVCLKWIDGEPLRHHTSGMLAWHNEDIYVCWTSGILRPHEPRLELGDEELEELRELCREVYCNWCGHLATDNPCFDCIERYESTRALVP